MGTLAIKKLQKAVDAIFSLLLLWGWLPRLCLKYRLTVLLDDGL